MTPPISPLEALSSCPNKCYQNVEPISPAVRGVLRGVQQRGSINDAALSHLVEDMSSTLPVKIEVVCPRYPDGSNDTAYIYELTQDDDSRARLARKLGCTTCSFRTTRIEKSEQDPSIDAVTQVEVRRVGS